MTESRLQDSARQALAQAQAEATRLGHDVVGSEHLLLGVLRTSPLAAQVIDALGLQDSQVLQRLEAGPRKVRRRGDEAAADGQLPLSSHARRLLEGAGGDVDDVSLLLAAVGDAKGTLGKILGERGVSVAAARAEILRRAGRAVDAAPAPAAPRPPRSDARPDVGERPPRAEPRERKPKGSDAPRAERRPRHAPEPAEEPVVRAPSLGKLAPRPKQRAPLWRTLLLAAVPAAVAAQYLHAAPVLVFGLACLAVLPLAGIMGEATEHLAAKTGPTVGGLLNATFGNAAEMIIAIMGLRAALVAASPERQALLVDVVKASITGSILGNLLLILGLVFVAGGFNRPVLRFNRTAAGMSAGMLFLAIVSLVLPAMFHYLHPEASARAAERTLSLEMSVILLLTYAASLVFSLRTHSALIGGEAHPVEGPVWTTGRAALTLGAATVGVAWMSEILVHSIGEVTESLRLSAMFLGLIVVPIVGNAAEHAAAVVFARKGQMDLALQIALGSSTQIALLVAPLLVFIGWGMGVPMDLVFKPFEVIALALATITAAVLMLDGESHWFEGVQLLALYGMVAIAAFFI